MPDRVRMDEKLQDRLYRRCGDAWRCLASFVAALLVVIAALSGCGSNETQPGPAETPTDASTTATAGEPTGESRSAQPSPDQDSSEADNSAAELGRAADEEVSVEQPVSPEQREAEEAFRAMTAKGISPEELDAATEKLLSIGAPAAPVLADGLQADDALHREMAATMLVLLGPEASAASEELMDALQDDSAFVRANSATAFAQMDGTSAEVIPVYEEMLGGDDPELRSMMAKNLSLLDASVAQPLLGRLIALLEEDDREVQLAVVDMLGRMGPDASQATEALKQLSSRDSVDEELRSTIENALNQIAGKMD